MSRSVKGGSEKKIIFLFQAQQCYQAKINYPTLEQVAACQIIFASEKFSSLLKSHNPLYLSSNGKKSIISLI